MNERELRNLLERIGTGQDKKAEEELAHYFTNRFMKVMMLAAHRQYSKMKIEDAEEVAQDTFIALLKELRQNKCKNPSAFGAYVWKIFHHQCQNWIRTLNTDKRGGNSQFVASEASLLLKCCSKYLEQHQTSSYSRKLK